MGRAPPSGSKPSVGSRAIARPNPAARPSRRTGVSSHAGHARSRDASGTADDRFRAWRLRRPRRCRHDQADGPRGAGPPRCLRSHAGPSRFATPRRCFSTVHRRQPPVFTHAVDTSIGRQMSQAPDAGLIVGTTPSLTSLDRPHALLIRARLVLPDARFSQPRRSMCERCGSRRLRGKPAKPAPPLRFGPGAKPSFAGVPQAPGPPRSRARRRGSRPSPD
jgi:hypothetical protein